MNRFVHHRNTIIVLIALACIASTMAWPSLKLAHATDTKDNVTTKSVFCNRLGKSIEASESAQVWCTGSQHNSSSQNKGGIKSKIFGSNIDAADPAEDRNPAGVQSYGQSQVSIASINPYVVEAWTDSTGFISPCGSPMYKEEFVGFGFSANGGSSFIDEGGLPNNNCTSSGYLGDPSVEAWHSGNSAYFYISGTYYPSSSFTGGDPRTHVAIAACKASGVGKSSTISCSQPIVVASSTQCDSKGHLCSVLNKDFLSIDPLHGRLYLSYTEFGINAFPSDNLTNGQVELATCDIGTPTGGTGVAGGTAKKPICFNKDSGTALNPATPYFVVARGDRSCENEGAYPAVDDATGDVYMTYEFNWGSNFLNPACTSRLTMDMIKYIPFSCLKLINRSPCSNPIASNGVSIVSLDNAFIPGYNRYPANDFPRIAVSNKMGTVSIVWNDARQHVLGDIMLQSFKLVSLTRVQSAPLRLNSIASGGLHFLPALRYSDGNGNVEVSWYGRSSPSTALTDVYVINVNPLITNFSVKETLVTTTPSNWNIVSSDITPNFGDYTDNYIRTTSDAPYTIKADYIAWTDGRTGEPQPFEAHY